jgi:hypothetical protein
MMRCMFGALLGACMADFGTQCVEFLLETRISRNEPGAQRANVGAVAAQGDAFFIAILDAIRDTLFACDHARQASVDTTY